MKKISKAIIEKGKKHAIRQTEWVCRGFFNQPKVPAKLLEMKNGTKN